MFALKPTCGNYVVWYYLSRSFYTLLCDMWLTLTLRSKNKIIEWLKEKKRKKEERKEKGESDKEESENN